MKSVQECIDRLGTISLFSPDPSRKTACIIVLKNGEISACNNFPAGVSVSAERLERPTKYAFMEHAERNAIYHAARFGHRLENAEMFLSWYPCADCARAIVQSGISFLYAMEPNWAETQYGFDAAKVILAEGGVHVEFYGKMVEPAK